MSYYEGMKIMLQLAIIFTIIIISELISSILPIPVPGSIIGLLIVLLLLFAKILKEDHIKQTSSFFLDNMSIFFIPACAGIIEHLELVKSAWWQIITIAVVSFFLTFIASAYTVILVQRIMKRRES